MAPWSKKVHKSVLIVLESKQCKCPQLLPIAISNNDALFIKLMLFS